MEYGTQRVELFKPKGSRFPSSRGRWDWKILLPASHGDGGWVGKSREQEKREKIKMLKRIEDNYTGGWAILQLWCRKLNDRKLNKNKSVLVKFLIHFFFYNCYYWKSVYPFRGATAAVKYKPALKNEW